MDARVAGGCQRFTGQEAQPRQAMNPPGRAWISQHSPKPGLRWPRCDPPHRPCRTWGGGKGLLSPRFRAVNNSPKTRQEGLGTPSPLLLKYLCPQDSPSMSGTAHILGHPSGLPWGVAPHPSPLPSAPLAYCPTLSRGSRLLQLQSPGQSNLCPQHRWSGSGRETLLQEEREAKPALEGQGAPRPRVGWGGHGWGCVSAVGLNAAAGGICGRGGGGCHLHPGEGRAGGDTLPAAPRKQILKGRWKKGVW